MPNTQKYKKTTKKKKMNKCGCGGTIELKSTGQKTLAEIKEGIKSQATLICNQCGKGWIEWNPNKQKLKNTHGKNTQKVSKLSWLRWVFLLS